jgi:ATP-dependent DNA helicase RecG
MFKECGLIEKYGSGIERIKKLCKEHGIITPKFEEIQKGFQVTLYKEKVNEGVNEGVNGGVKSLYALIKKFPNNKTPFFAKELNTSIKNIERWIKQLKIEDKIEFKGSPKTGGYFVK